MSEISKERKQFWANETQTTLRELIFNQSQPSLSYEKVKTKFLENVKDQKIPYFIGNDSGNKVSENAFKNHKWSEASFPFLLVIPMMLFSISTLSLPLFLCWLVVALAAASVATGITLSIKVRPGMEAFTTDFDEAYTSLKQELDSINQTNPSPNFSIE